MAITSTVKMRKFSDKYIEYYKRCLDNRINCLEGAYRAGKSTINLFSFANHIEYCYDKFHLVSGVSSSKARLNIAEADGRGLTSIFRGRCQHTKYEGNECLRIKSKCGEKVVIFVGGAKSDSHKMIQGLSFGSWIAVELAQHYISKDDKDFVDMALSRLTQSRCRKVWWDLNPTFPTNIVYTKYLDRYSEEQEKGIFPGGYNYMSCSLFDNDTLDDDQREEALSRYPDKESMEYKRYILGLRACAEGLIFSLFAKESSNWIVNDLSEFIKSVAIQFISIGVDFGGNGSDTVFVATLVYNNFKGVLVLRDDKLVMDGGEKDSFDFREKFKEFLLFIISLGVANVRYVYGDSADTVMINDIRRVIKELKMVNNIRILGCYKGTIKERIDSKKQMMAEGRWHVCKEATNVIDSTRTQVWDSRDGHEDERLDNGSVDIDTADAEEYSWSSYIDKLTRV